MNDNFLRFLMDRYGGSPLRVLVFMAIVTGVAYGFKWLLYDWALTDTRPGLLFLGVAFISQLGLVVLAQWLRKQYPTAKNR